MKIIVTGGAGYIGSVVVNKLLRDDHEVIVIDNLMFGGESIVSNLNNPKFTFIKGDIRHKEMYEKHFKNSDVVIHLAAIVGDPACSKHNDLARSVNLDATKILFECADENAVKKFIFASTCSNYGKMNNSDSYLTEDDDLNPISLYAETKVAAEAYLLQQTGSTCRPTCLRFSTVYGLSPRTRFDLTVNEFTKDLALNRELIIFGEQFWRPYCHVNDLAASTILIAQSESSKPDFNTYNVGCTNENYTKKMLIENIQKEVPNTKIKYVKKDEDPRDYKVSFEKIKLELGFQITKTVNDGIREINHAVKMGLFENPDDAKHRNI